MNYCDFTIIRTCYGTWKVQVNIHEEWLATSKEDAMKQVDDYIKRLRKN